MSKSDSNTYDAVIIGAGIGGLVCGCYLAKAGMKVLIAEQHHKPGGYCTSFKRKGFTFDAAAHSFGGYREGGIVRKVFSDLGLTGKIRIKRHNPSDIILTPDCKISFWDNVDRTIEEFGRVFPREHNNVSNFFQLMINPPPTFFARTRSWTFRGLLDKYFLDYKLKAILSLPIYGNCGIAPSKLSACMGAQIFTEFLLDGGYHPDGNMQMLPDILSKAFQDFGGELLLSCAVKRISTKEEKVTGVVLQGGDFIASQYVISNCDARQTFLKLLGSISSDEAFFHRIRRMIPSLSAFILFLGIDNHLCVPDPGNIWILSKHSSGYISPSARRIDVNKLAGYLMHVSTYSKSLVAFLNVPFINEKYWVDQRENMSESLIGKIEADMLPGLSKHIVFKDAATPLTLHSYTGNYKGATFGWASTPSQLALPDLRKPPFLKGIYLTGHWITQGLGISGVVRVSYDTAKLILRREKRIK